MLTPTALDVRSTTDTQIATFSDKLSVNGVAARRSKAPRMGGGIAAHASSDMFKSPVSIRASVLGEGCSDGVIGTWQTKGEKMGSYVRLNPPVSGSLSTELMVGQIG